jgi:glycosyltransferase involved in cell wall biosynthesis
MTLLRDALDRTLLEPQCARRWHGLMAVWKSFPDRAARQSVVDRLAGLPDGEARSDILRLTFLAHASGNPGFENAAAARVLAMTPHDPDRLASFMAYQWLTALQHLQDRPQFIAALAAARVPEMALRLKRSAAEALPPALVPRVAEEIRRVAVVVPYVGHRFHTPSVLAVEQCALLAAAGLQVQLFSAQELLPPDAAQFRGDGRELALPPLDAQTWAKLLPAGVRMTISDSRFSLPGRWRKLMPALAEFDADAVLLVGLYSPLAAALHAVRPVAAISVNSVPPIAPADVWLAADATPEPQAGWGGVFSPPQPVHHPWRVKRSRKQWPVTRAELGLDDAAVVWITAGFRLEHEITPAWAQRLLDLMARHPQVVWLVIGGAGKLPGALRDAAPERVRALPTRDDLPGILRIGDIYLNPPRMGGGHSVAEAMAEGLAVLSLAGSDGGDKVGELALPDMDAYLARLAALTADPALRRETGQALRRRFDERFDLDASGPALLAALHQAAAAARGRLTTPS